MTIWEIPEMATLAQLDKIIVVNNDSAELSGKNWKDSAFPWEKLAKNLLVRTN